jgi:hypothetical protein
MSRVVPDGRHRVSCMGKNDITYVGLDVHKATVCVAVAESGRSGEVRQIGVFEN